MTVETCRDHESETKLSKIHCSFNRAVALRVGGHRYTAKSNLLNISTFPRLNAFVVGSALSPEELQPHAWNWTAYRGTQNIEEYSSWSNEILFFTADHPPSRAASSYARGFGVTKTARQARIYRIGERARLGCGRSRPGFANF
jgi:hypothetical protein